MSFSLPGLVLAGLLTFLSPCVLPLAPFLTASLVAAGGSRAARVKATAWFALGFTIVFVGLGIGAGALGEAIGQAKPALYLVGAIVSILFGLKMMGIITTAGPFSWMERSLRVPDFSRKLPQGLQGLAFGAVFGLGWTPCVGPVLGAVLTYVASSQASPARGALMLFAFSVGLSLPLFGIALAIDRARPWLEKLKKFLPKIEYAAGLGLTIFGVLLLNQARFSVDPAPAAGAPVAALNDRHEQLSLGAATPRLGRMVFFYTDTCPICHAMERYLSEFENQCSSKNFQFSRVNVGWPGNAQASERYQVRAVPQISVFDGEGREVIHLIGYQTEARLREAARSITGLVCQQGGECTAGPGC